MRSLGVTEAALVATASKRISWLFTVTTVAPVTYYWSTKAVTFGAQAYAFKVILDSFKGITLNRAMSEIGIQAPSTLSFDIANSGSTLTASDFVGATVQVDLVLSDWIDEEICAAWKFRVIRCEAGYQKLSFACEDFVQQYLQGDYPNTPLIRDLVPNSETDPQDNLCVPVVFGVGYVPLRSVYVSGLTARRYVMGLASDVVAASGTATRKDARLSMIDGTAFVWLAGVDLSPYAGVAGSSTPYIIEVTDGAGVKAWGYLAEQGAGETLTTEKIVNGGFATDTDWVKNTGWTISGGTGNVDRDSTGWESMSQALTDWADYKLYKCSYDITTISEEIGRAHV